MEVSKKVPALRFYGFSTEWSTKVLSNILSERNEQFCKSDDYPLMAFIAHIGVSSKGDRYNREFLVTDHINKKYKRTEKGDFIYSSNNLETGSIGLNNYGNASLSPVYSIFKSSEFTNSEFVGRTLVRKSFINKMVKWRQGVVYGQWKIPEKSFLSLDISVPRLSEQSKIGNYFKELDELIRLQEQKHKKLLNLKKAMLDKMFPKEGADVPEIRFKGFTDKWEKKKLEALANFTKGQGYSKKDLIATGEPIILYGRLYTKYESQISAVDTYVKPLSISVYSKGNEVIVPASGESAEDISRASAVLSSGIILGGDLNIISPHKGICPTYLALLLTFSISRFDIQRRAKGKSVVHVHNSDLQEVVVQFPTLEEQEQIGAYFENLDKLIAQSQEQITKYKNIKQALLQKMFV